MAAKWSDFVAGAVLTAAQLNDVIDNFEDVAIFNETQASGTNGGASVAAYTKRTLNTTVVNNIAGCSIASSVITLAAGTYEVYAAAPANGGVNRNKLRLQNTSDATTTQVGQNAFATSLATLHTVFTIASSKNFELQHRCEIVVATSGLGIAASFGDSEIYASIMIRRIA
jgi:hypothetical protein